MDVDSQRDGGWWLPESRLDVEKIELEISLGWLMSKFTAFAYFINSKGTGRSLRYVKRVLVSKEDGLEIHYKDALSGLEEIIYFQSKHISAVHYWISKTKDFDGEDRTVNFAIVANSVIHKIPGGKKEIRQLCEILELDLQRISPNFKELQNYNFPE
tara:strand:- start:166 stop:636 length:471 start_codon:yes stop_codon:yes gene_type:complete